ncbi:MAG: hypothetical protein ACLRM9_08995 [Collinsella aerofaciens]
MSMSSAISPETATAALVVTGPTSACMPQSHRVLKALISLAVGDVVSDLGELEVLGREILTASLAPADRDAIGLPRHRSRTMTPILNAPSPSAEPSEPPGQPASATAAERGGAGEEVPTAECR